VETLAFGRDGVQVALRGVAAPGAAGAAAEVAEVAGAAPGVGVYGVAGEVAEGGARQDRGQATPLTTLHRWEWNTPPICHAELVEAPFGGVSSGKGSVLCYVGLLP